RPAPARRPRRCSASTRPGSCSGSSGSRRPRSTGCERPASSSARFHRAPQEDARSSLGSGGAVTPIVAPARPPEDPRVRAIWKLVGHDAARRRPHDQREIGTPIDLGDGRGGESAVPGGAEVVPGKIAPVELDTQTIENVELSDTARGLLGPGGEDHLGAAVVVKVDHYRLARKAE